MEIPVRCNKCNKLLFSAMNSEGEIMVILCPSSEESIRDKAYEEGYADAKMESAQDKL